MQSEVWDSHSWPRVYPGLQGGCGHLGLRLLDIQVPLEAAEELRMEWEHHRLDLAQGPWEAGNKRRSSGWSCRESLWLDGLQA